MHEALFLLCEYIDFGLFEMKARATFKITNKKNSASSQRRRLLTLEALSCPRMKFLMLERRGRANKARQLKFFWQ
jgi:hypothetical protein